MGGNVAVVHSMFSYFSSSYNYKLELVSLKRRGK